jgi:ssDNA-binding Zn-finger/Zn-ribbon topoisomerase 1
MVIRTGQRGRFLACSAFPKCRNTRPLPEDEAAAEEAAGSAKCDICGRPMAVKKGRYGLFLGCTGYPECKGIKRLPAREKAEET